MSALPFHISELSPRRLNAFKNFLNQSGAEIFSSRSNAYEVLRFRAAGEMATVYRNAAGKLTFVGPVKPAWTAFTGNLPYRASPKSTRQKGEERATLVATLIERDGAACFYCAEPVAASLATIEHLLPLTTGGTRHLANTVIAHRRCNERAGTLSLFEKIRLRDRLRGIGSRIDAALEAVRDGL